MSDNAAHMIHAPLCRSVDRCERKAMAWGKTICTLNGVCGYQCYIHEAARAHDAGSEP